jgi:demethylmenaquinone methyltransferase/2-methoxy-6-polyprenyl-1,4-benzoquinol methylase
MALPLNLDATPAPDAEYIRSMFDRMARRYDWFTAVIGFGQAQRWRRAALAPVAPGMRVLDLGCGTGDLSVAAAEAVGRSGEVVGLDFSEAMLGVAARKYARRRREGWGAFTPWPGRAEALPLPTGPFDVVVSGFVLRNLYAQIERILEGVRRSLVPGGRVSFLDLTEPAHPILRGGFRLYMLGPVGAYGAALFGRDYPIPYLPDSARRFLKAHEFPQALRRAGFEDVRVRSFMLGTVTLYSARINDEPRPAN